MLREELTPFGIRTLIVEPGAFRTNAYAGFADETIRDIGDYLPEFEQIHAAMVASDGRQAGDPRRGVEAVLAAMDEPEPPFRLVLGSDGFDGVVHALTDRLRDVCSHESQARASDFTASQ